MKKTLTIIATLLLSMSVFAQFGILVNGKTYYAGAENPTPQDKSFREFMVLGLAVNAGDFCQLCDKGSNYATWAVELDGASVSAIQRSDNKYTISKSGCYDFYIKIKNQQDQLYVGEGNCGSPKGEDISGGQGGNQGGSDDDVNYYAIGWINGDDHGEDEYDTYEDEYLFVDGKLTIDCKMGSYIAIKDHLGNFYYSKTPTTIANESVTMDWANGWSGCEKWAIPEGVNYIIIRNAQFKGKIQLERVDKATYDAYQWGETPTAVENTPASGKARKVFVDGQLRIVRGDRVFDLTGREL